MKKALLITSFTITVFAIQANAANYQVTYDDLGRVSERVEDWKRLVYTYNEDGSTTVKQYNYNRPNPASTVSYDAKGEYVYRINYKDGGQSTEVQNIYSRDVFDTDNDGKYDEVIAYKCSTTDCSTKTVESRFIYTPDPSNPNVRNVEYQYTCSSTNGSVSCSGSRQNGSEIYINGEWKQNKTYMLTCGRTCTSWYKETEYDENGNQIYDGSKPPVIYYNQYDELGHLTSIKTKTCGSSETYDECKAHLSEPDSAFWNGATINNYINVCDSVCAKNSRRNQLEEVYNENDGSYTIFDKNGNVIGYKGKRIYTVEEATKLSKEPGNTFKLRYK